MTAYAFKNAYTAKTLAEMVEKNPPSVLLNIPDGNDVAPRVNFVRLLEDLSGVVEDLDGTQMIPAVTAEKYQTSNDEESAKIHRFMGMGSELKGSSLEETNLPEGAKVLSVSDSFNSNLFFSVTPSECFGTLSAEWSGDYSSSVTIELSEGFTIGGLSLVNAYPAPTLDSSVPLPAGTAVEVRFIKSLGTWFFFKPSSGSSSLTAETSGEWYFPAEVSGTGIPALPAKLYYRSDLGTDVFPADLVECEAIQTFYSGYIWIRTESHIVCKNDSSVNLLSGIWLAYPWDHENQKFAGTAPEFIRLEASNYTFPDTLGWHLALSNSTTILGEKGEVDGETFYASYHEGTSLYFDASHGYWAFNPYGTPDRQEGNFGTSPPPSFEGDAEVYGSYTLTYHQNVNPADYAPDFGFVHFSSASLDFVEVSLAENYTSGKSLTGTLNFTLSNNWGRYTPDSVFRYETFSLDHGSVKIPASIPRGVSWHGEFSGMDLILLSPEVPEVNPKEYESFWSFLNENDFTIYPIRNFNTEYYFPDPESCSGRWVFPENYLTQTCDFASGSGISTFTLLELVDLREALTVGEKDGVSGFFYYDQFHPSESSPLLEGFTANYTFADELTQSFTLYGVFQSDPADSNCTVKLGRYLAEKLI